MCRVTRYQYECLLRIFSAYFHSAATLNYIRARLASGLADLHSALDWSLGHVQDQRLQAQYQQIVDPITDSLRFMRTIGADTTTRLDTVDFFCFP